MYTLYEPFTDPVTDPYPVKDNSSFRLNMRYKGVQKHPWFCQVADHIVMLTYMTSDNEDKFHIVASMLDFRLLKPIPDIQANVAKFFSISIPTDIFPAELPRPEIEFYLEDVTVRDRDLLSEPLLSWLQWIPSTWTLSGYPPADAAHSYRIRLRAVFPDGFMTVTSFNLIIHRPPIPNCVSKEYFLEEGECWHCDQDLSFTSEYEFSVQATLADDSPLPDWLVFDSANSKLDSEQV